jgi:hypothetical protein
MQTAYYRDFVFGGQRVVHRGFIEDKLGSLMLEDLRALGHAAHAKYGTWLFVDDVGTPMVAHLNGRGVLLEEERQRRIRAGQSGAQAHDQLPDSEELEAAASSQ